MSRRNAEGGYDLKATVTEQSEITAIVDAIDTLIVREPRTDCLETFRITFTTSSGDQTFGTICRGNSDLFRGDQSFWEGLEGTVPDEFSDIIGPYLANDPHPGLPS